MRRKADYNEQFSSLRDTRKRIKDVFQANGYLKTELGLCWAKHLLSAVNSPGGQ